MQNCKTARRILSIALAVVLVCAFMTPLAACKKKKYDDEPHVCAHKCQICEKCTDETCTDPSCANKCVGHLKPGDEQTDDHTCTHKCPTCNKCDDPNCPDDVCADKCQGHPAAHVCATTCTTCGKCTSNCADPVCSEKCLGHTSVVVHECKHVCATCNKCTDETCTDPVCANKCSGHAVLHQCQSKCDVCQKCTNLACDDTACADKCPGHAPAHVCQSKCETCNKCTNTECNDAVCVDKCPGHNVEPQHVCEHKCIVCDLCRDTTCKNPICANKCPGHDQPPEPQPDVTLSYTFSGTHEQAAGYAEGTVSVAVKTSGRYFLYWADDNAALEGFYEIASFNVSANSSKSFTFGYHTAIPAGATKIIAVKNTDNLSVESADAVLDLPENKLMGLRPDDLLYTFNSYSDVHIHDGDFYVNDERNWTQALQYAYNKNVNFVVTSGDMVTNDNGPANEWAVYRRILAQSPYCNPIWESNGNHDLRTEKTFQTGQNTYIRSSGTDTSVAYNKNNNPYYYEIEQNTGDVFIFMALETDFETKQYDEFTDAQMAWLENLLATYYNTGRNIYIIQHATIGGFGPGDRMSDPLYGGHLTDTFKNVGRFKNILQTYPDLIWMSGHTHEDFSMDYNYSDENGTACHMIHNPSVVGTTWAPEGATSLNYNGGAGFNSQGYYVQVYANAIIYYGSDLTAEKIYPAYCYMIEAGRSSATNFAETPQNNTSASTVFDDQTIDQVLTTVQDKLATNFKFASYDQYQYLKKLYNAYSDERPTNTSSAIMQLANAYTALDDVVNNVCRTVYYFENKQDWSNVYCYAWNDRGYQKSWPGTKLTDVVGQNGEGHNIYKLQFDYPGQYDYLIFNNGKSFPDGKQTINIDLFGYQANCFWVTSSTYGADYKYIVNEYGCRPYLAYYINGYHQWTDFDSSVNKFAEIDEETFVLDVVATSSLAFSCKVCYKGKTNSFYCLPESTSVAYNVGDTYEYVLSAGAQSGRSLTINGLSAGDVMHFVYNQKTGKLTVTFPSD